jgi:hypothetical protein
MFVGHSWVRVESSHPPGFAGFGAAALFQNTSGSNNTANGYSALSGNTIGFENTAIGYYAMNNNTTGNQNTAHGKFRRKPVRHMRTSRYGERTS